MKRLLATTSSVAFGVLLVPASGMASTIYPRTIERGVGLTAAPECTLCHTTNRGGTNTASKPLAATLMSLGLEGGANSDALEVAIVTAEAESTDSDAGGVPDIDELLLGTDPNEPADDAGDAPPPAGRWFGGATTDATSASCSASPHSTASGPWGALASVLVPLALSVRRNRSQSG